MSDASIANDNGEPAWSKFLGALVEPGDEAPPEEPAPDTTE